ncbi:LacI family DNA-binding transcriptional regulator [Rhodococcus sp. NPDC055112]
MNGPISPMPARGNGTYDGTESVPVRSVASMPPSPGEDAKTVITTKDIAQRLELSVSTVGRALTDDARISERTKLRVRKAAEEMGYVSNRAARMMRGISSNVVALVIPDVRNSFYSTIAHELSKNLQAEGFQLMLSETDDEPDAELQHLRELSASRIAGVIIVPTARPRPETVSLLNGLPHIQMLRRHRSLGPDWCGIDDHRALKMATAHLVDLGHRRIGYIGGPVALPTGKQRLKGFRDALRAGGLESHVHLVEHISPAAEDNGRQALRRLLDTPTPPTAIVVGSVRLTTGVLDELFRSGTTIPDELSVTGFGDEPGFSWWGPGLTTLRLPIGDMATACGLRLLERLTDRASDPDTTFSSKQLGELVFRGSTAPPTGPGIGAV